LIPRTPRFARRGIECAGSNGRFAPFIRRDAGNEFEEI